ncbi:TetR family transcriptional regulator C-terminal domain-containing protein [Polaribacter sp.]|uniref:TetR family transcriptional regulator C-terminal domain-containing protein n=1 Tax=Polaribacter sp. TaxID=1920175 RepID=UPI0025D61878|nr:TetR family transcriptional regulator C-terminal domain-containing protein [Polaribacter sp.]
MENKNKISKIDIITLYMELVSESKKRPKSIKQFCRKTGLDKKVFYHNFSSLEKVEKFIFKTLFKNSLAVLEESEEFGSFDKKNKLISLYFTFFENLTLNKDYLNIVLKGCKNKLQAHKTLSSLEKSFKKFIDTLALGENKLPIEGLEKVQKNVIRQSAWVQLLVTMHFWLEDNSDSFEKTDIFIEKSINTSFDLLENKFLKNVLDLGKFVYKERFQKSTD